VVAPGELLPTCGEIAEDILSCVPGVPALKGLIDDGYATTLGEGLSKEAKQPPHRGGICRPWHCETISS